MSEVTSETPSIETVREAFEQEFGRFAALREDSRAAEDEQRSVADLRTRHLGKKSQLATLKKQIGRVAPDERAAFAQTVQNLEADITGRIADVEAVLSEAVKQASLERERLDVTLPGRRTAHGHLHPITLLRERIDDVFVSLGYAIEDGAEIETDFYNFEALNIPDGHPARSPQDTFYTTNGLALRSQTSTMQIHAMERRGVPLRVAASGRVFRRDTPDATHNPMFFQVEGLCVDKGITMADLKGCLLYTSPRPRD